MVLTLRASALLSRSSSGPGASGARAARPTASFSLEPPQEAIVREGGASALVASFIEEDRREAEAEAEANRTDAAAAAAATAALKLRSVAKGAKQTVASRKERAKDAAQHALALSESFGDHSVVSGDALESGDVGAVLAVVSGGGKPVPGTRWVEYVDEEDYVGTTYYHNLDTGESVWEPPEEVLASQKHKQKRLLAGMGVESFSEKARESLVGSFIEEQRKEQELAARNARASASRPAALQVHACGASEAHARGSIRRPRSFTRPPPRPPPHAPAHAPPSPLRGRYLHDLPHHHVIHVPLLEQELLAHFIVVHLD